MKEQTRSDQNYKKIINKELNNENNLLKFQKEKLNIENKKLNNENKK